MGVARLFYLSPPETDLADAVCFWRVADVPVRVSVIRGGAEIFRPASIYYPTENAPGPQEFRLFSFNARACTYERYACRRKNERLSGGPPRWYRLWRFSRAKKHRRDRERSPDNGFFLGRSARGNTVSVKPVAIVRNARHRPSVRSSRKRVGSVRPRRNCRRFCAVGKL